MHKFWRNRGVVVLVITAWTSYTAGTPPEQTQPVPTHQHNAGQSAGKPSAHIELADLASLELIPGEARGVTVTLKSGYSQGEIAVQVSGAGPLEVMGGAQMFRFDLAANGAYDLPLELYTSVPGRHYLHITVQVDSPEAHMHSRALAVIVNAGVAALPEPHLEPPATVGKGEKIHSLPAREQVE